MSSVELHGFFRASAAFRVRIALNLKNIAYSQVSYDLRAGDQRRASYLTLNPAGLVPTLKIDGLNLVQSVAICEYLDETRPAPPFLPVSPAERARVRALAQACTSDIHPINNLRVLKYLEMELDQPQTVVDAWRRHWVQRGFTSIEARLSSESATGHFCHGEAPTLADLCLIPQVWNARRFEISLEAFPTITRIYAACMALPAFANASPERQPDAN